MPRTQVILVDQRERKPLPFPKRITDLELGLGRQGAVTLEIRRKRLAVADYMLDGLRGNCYTAGAGAAVIETKRSLSELHGNVFGKKRPNFVRLLSRMRERFRFPLLVVEGLVFNPDDEDAGPVCDAFQRLLMEHGVPHLMFAPCNTPAQRRKLAWYAARWLVNGALTYERTPHNDEDRNGD
jgi:hypothetical protein